MRSEKINISRAIDLLNARSIACNRATVWRWCTSGLLAAEKDTLTGRWQPYLAAVQEFKPPKRGNPRIKTLRRRTLRRKITSQK